MDELNSATTMADTSGRSVASLSRGEHDRRFRAAVRHSRTVRFLRWAIPCGLLMGVAFFAAAAWLNPLRNALAKLPIDPGSLVVSGTKITMEAPRVAGFTRDARPYELTAKAAAQDLTRPGILELKGIQAKVQMKDTATIDMHAAAGLYDTKTDLLKLDDQIVITSTSGYKGQLREAVVDIKKGKITSSLPVVVDMLNGTLNANSLEVGENGDVITFGGGVVMDLVLGAGKDGKRRAAR
jgi:lipopolysaccharide export system protein LptC